jgi:matrixin/carboxypeptidase family protein
MTRRLLAVLAVLAASVLAPPSLDAYLKLGSIVNGRVVSRHWTQFPIRYFVTDRSVPNVSSEQLQQAVTTAFSTWAAVPGISISSQFAGFTQVGPLDNNNLTVIGFDNQPQLDRVLGATTFTVDIITGDIVESDIFFNSAFAWSVAAAGETGRFDIGSIALHEIGHLHGLGHSALGETQLIGGGRRVIAKEAVMFPIAFAAGTVADRTLRADDIAGVEDIYGTSAFRQTTGSISGRVTKNGAGVQGAHVIAFNPKTGKLVAGFTLSSDGTFTIASLAPGFYSVRAEPLDDADAISFFPPSFAVDLSFQPAFYDRVVAVPRGGTASGIEVKVAPK